MPSEHGVRRRFVGLGTRINKVSGYLRSGAAKQKLLQNPPLFWGENPSEKQFRRLFRFSFATLLRYAGSLKPQNLTPQNAASRFRRNDLTPKS